MPTAGGMTAWRAANRAAGRPIPDHVHGTNTGVTNWRCTCQPCRDAFNARQRRYYANRSEAAKERRRQSRRKNPLRSGDGSWHDEHMTATTTQQASVDRAISTVLGEVETTSAADLLDALYMILGGTIVDEHESYILGRFHAYGIDISAWCEGHETTDGPIGVAEYCNGLCEARQW